MTTLLTVALITALALFLRERRIRKTHVKDWSVAYSRLWDDYAFIACTLEEITGIDIL
jgi:hypothetical protein